jgi:hypothetical protein
LWPFRIESWKGVVMFVDTDGLHSGANQTHRAGGYAKDGADQLSRAPLALGMFGDFAAADTYYDAISAAHSAHIKTFLGQHDMLTALGHKARLAAAVFTDMDESNAARLRLGRCNDFGT